MKISYTEDRRLDAELDLMCRRLGLDSKKCGAVVEVDPVSADAVELRVTAMFDSRSGAQPTAESASGHATKSTNFDPVDAVVDDGVLWAALSNLKKKIGTVLRAA